MLTSLSMRQRKKILDKLCCPFTFYCNIFFNGHMDFNTFITYLFLQLIFLCYVQKCITTLVFYNILNTPFANLWINYMHQLNLSLNVNISNSPKCRIFGLHMQRHCELHFKYLIDCRNTHTPFFSLLFDLHAMFASV